ncbi:MAG: carboxypeptidase-like regulatory domain-containing protein [Armatimonadota bacterium]|nr:carboxypeptidase-like regulatory domain-containing protein [Armatimonadota bacterium]
MRTRYVVMLALWCVWSVAEAQGTRVLTGRVLDAQGNPVSGAQVYYYPNLFVTFMGVPAEKLPKATTDEQGRYRLTGANLLLTPVSQVLAFHPQHGCNASEIGKRPPRDLRLLPLQEFQGKVVDAEGRPVAGAAVRLVALGIEEGKLILPPPTPPFVVQTDREGAFRLPAHSQMQWLMLVVTAAGYEPLVFNGNVTWEKVSKEGIQLTLKPGARVTGQLVYAHNGEPVRNYPVVVARYSTCAFTDQNGRFVLDVGAGEVTIKPGFSLDNPSLVPPGVFPRVQLQNIQPGTTTDVGVIRVYTEPVVTVEVRDDKGHAVPFCAVEVSPAEGRREDAFPLPYFTDARGQLRFPLAEGKYRLVASGAASANLYYTSREVKEITVREGRVVDAQPIVLQVTATRIDRPQQAKMQVRTSRGQLPKKVWVQAGNLLYDLVEEIGSEWRPYRLDGDLLSIEVGGVEGRILDRLFVVDTVLWEGAVLRNVSANALPKKVRLQPLPRVYGRVLDGAGKPVVGARVSLVFGRNSTLPDGSGRMWVETSVPIAVNTDKTGRFALPLLPEGTCWAVATGRGYEPAAAVLRRGQAVTLWLKGASGEYAGVLVDEYGEPVAKMRIDLRYTFSESQTMQNRQQRRLPTREVSLGHVITDEAGRFALRGMPSSLLLTMRTEFGPPMRFRATPSRQLALTRNALRPPWEREQSPPQPNVEKLLRAVEWMQPVQWQGKQTLLVFTAPYLTGNEETLQAIARQLREGWQVALVLDTASRAEAESYRRRLGVELPVGYWKKAPNRPRVPSLPHILPGMPYLVHLGEDGKPLRVGVKVEEVNRLFAQGER